mmetsp:Transcript_18681/g.30329  ORF Transcript_18681/g.30329 Transcript_18681/m.30329 type:complete len:131 (-) Transcript_18681:479-871(-)
MVRVSALSDAFKSIMVAERAGKKQVLIRPVSKLIIKVLSIMLKYNYINSFQFIDDHRAGKIVINLNGRINKCGAISPRFNLRKHNLNLFVDKILPSRLFGKVLLSTSKGIMDHTHAVNKNTGGKILGFFY